MAKINKYIPLYVVQSSYPWARGWEDVTASHDRKEARANLRDYRLNEPAYSHRLITRREPNPAYLPERIFCGVFATGLSYADREKEEGGDYKRLAFISFSTLTLEVEKSCPAELRPYIERNAKLLQNKRGQEYQVDTCGHTVLLGQK